MYILGLTGSIATGKSVAARMLKHLYPLWHYDADKEVHRLMAPGGALVAQINKTFGDMSNEQGGIDRGKLGQRVFADKQALRTLEEIIHPALGKHKQKFLARAKRARVKLVLLDVPLLFETGGNKNCDSVLCMVAPLFLQIQRYSRRSGGSAEKLRGILKRQMSQHKKSLLSDYVIRSGNGKTAMQRTLAQILADIERKRNEKRNRFGYRNNGLRAPRRAQNR